MNSSKLTLWAGPITIGSGLILLLMDLITMFFFYNMCCDMSHASQLIIIIPVANVVITGLTILLGILLTIFARMKDNQNAMLAWILMDGILLAFEAAAVIYYMVVEIDVATLYAYQLGWGKK